MKRLYLGFLAIAVCLVSADPVDGQTARRFSVQASGLGSIPFSGDLSNVDPGPGIEAQLRYTPGLWSVGAGFEISWHTIDDTDRDVTLSGGFVEPRRVIDIGSDDVAPYVSARLALSRTKFEIGRISGTGTGFTVNGGGGFLFVLGSNTNLDVGATVGLKGMGSDTITDDQGEVTRFDLGSGANIVLRVGLAVGIAD